MASASIQIIRNAPPPPDRVTTGRKSKYPFRDLDVGDAFDVPCTRPATDKFRYPDYNGVTAACSFYNSKRSPLAGRRFKARLLDSEDGAKFVRVWRVA